MLAVNDLLFLPRFAAVRLVHFWYAELILIHSGVSLRMPSVWFALFKMS